MKRDMMKIAGAEWGHIPEGYQLTLSEINTLKEMLFPNQCPPEALWDVFGILFRYGFELGRRCEKRHGKKNPA